MKKIIFLSPLLHLSLLFAQEGTVASCKDATKTQPSACCETKEMFECWMRGDDPLTCVSLMPAAPAAYSYPANISVNDGWDIYANVSYLYWYAKQEGFNLAALGYDFDTSAWFPAASGEVFSQQGEYTSGFKVSLGGNLNVDDWAADLTYTYLRQHTATSTGAATGPTGETAVFNITSWYPLTWYGGQTVSTNVMSKWKMNLDWLDLQVSRPYYQGRRLIVTPTAGLRASWIRQRLHLQADGAYNTYIGAALPVTVTGANYSNSWAIGPRGVMGAAWLLGRGARVQGAMGGSLLFTQYTSISTRTSDIYVSDVPGYLGGIHVHKTNYNCVRAMAEANLGIGWGSYFYYNTYHIDVSATYDFNYLWAQNMIQNQWNENAVYGNNGTPGDLLLHGLDIKLRLDF